MFGLDLGVSKMEEHGPFGFDEGVGSVTSAGPAWGARAGIEVFRWLAFEARYIGAYNSVQTSVGAGGYFITGGEVVMRLTAPFPYIHPYVFGGGGYYDFSLIGATTGSVMFSSSQPGIAMGFGVDVPITWYMSIGAEATYHFNLGENFSNDTTNGIDGGDISTFNAVLRFRP
jgi:hypothetical protein